MAPPATGRAEPARVRPADRPGERPGERPGSRRGAARTPSFRVLTARDLAERTRRRRARAVLVSSGLLVFGSLLAVAVGQALVTSQQVRLDVVEQKLSAAVGDNQELQLQRADLASPARILEIAKRQLGMVTPGSVTYLPAVLPAQFTGTGSTTPVAPPTGSPARATGATVSATARTTTAGATATGSSSIPQSGGYSPTAKVRYIGPGAASSPVAARG